MKHLVIAALALSMMTATASAQQPPASNRPAPGQPPSAGPGQIRGKLVDESNAPIASASVSVRNAAGVLVAGAIANTDGTFTIDGLQPGAYTLRYTMIGYAIQNSQPV